MKHVLLRALSTVFVLAVFFSLGGCASNAKMSDDDRWLWEGGTNAPSSAPVK
jgi:hypothetical protein